jgi:Pyruvate/2-oxoacid:ferredoxin oxidoreductase delta subunit
MTSRRFILHFPAAVADRPVVSKLASQFHLDFNILRPAIDPGNEGMMYLEILGKADAITRGIAFLKSMGLSVTQLDQQIRRVDDRCTGCGACVGFCPVKCFAVDEKTGAVNFDNRHCTACGFCLKACTRRAMELVL